MNDVGAIQTSAHSYFDNGYVYFLVRKVAERHGGSQFKKRRMERFEEGTVLFYEVDYIFFRHHFSVDADAFAEVGPNGGK